MPWLSPLILEDAGDGIHWVVEQPLEWRDPRDATPRGHYIVPVGFVTDLASVPRLFWIWFPRDGKYRAAAVLHDWLCALIALGKSECDWAGTADIFRLAMEDCGVDWWTRNILWAFTREYGIWRVSQWRTEIS